MSLTLHFHPLASFCWKPLIAFYENDTPFTPVIVDLGDEQSRAAFLKISPPGKMPALRDDTRDCTVLESTIVIEYLAAHYPGPVELIPGDVDLAMLYSTSDPSGLAVHHGLSEEIFLFAASGTEGGPSGDTATLEETARLPLVIPGPGHGLRELIEEAALTAGVPLNPAIEIDSYSQIKKVVMRGLGFGILP